MISIYRKENTVATVDNDEEQKYITVELRGLSTDEKPTEINDDKVYNGSMFIEIDTGKIYIYDLENEQWKEV